MDDMPLARSEQVMMNGFHFIAETFGMPKKHPNTGLLPSQPNRSVLFGYTQIRFSYRADNSATHVVRTKTPRGTFAKLNLVSSD